MTVPPDSARTAPVRWPWLHLLLFVATFFSAILAHVIPKLDAHDAAEAVLRLWRMPAVLWEGLPFAGVLMAILVAHEMGHWWVARRQGVEQSLPYFIPAPTIFGTLGALIFMRSQPRDRRALLGVATAGPFAGLVIAVPALAWGLAHSAVAEVDRELAYGGSILGDLVAWAFGPGGGIADLTLHPVALAGWVGLFVTSLNLIPAAQLDGGHVAYALFGRRQPQLSRAVVGALLVLGLLLGFTGDNPVRGAVWVFWAIFLFILGIRHPPVRDPSVSLGRSHRLLAWGSLVLFALTFVPIPVERVGPTTNAESQPEVAPGPPNPYTGPAEEFRL